MHAQENLKKTAALNQQDIQLSSHFANEETVKVKPVTTKQSISPSHSSMKTPYNRNNTPFPLTTLKSSAKPTVLPINSQLN